MVQNLESDRCPERSHRQRPALHIARALVPVKFGSVPLDATELERKQRIEPVLSLNSSLLINTEGGSILRRIQANPGSVGCFVLKIWIVAGHVALQECALD